MSLPELRLRKAAGFLAIIVMGAMLGGCLRPMYGGSTGQALSGQLKSVSVDEIPGLVGHYLNQELAFAFTGGQSDQTARYRLAITLNQRYQTPVVDSVTGRAEAAVALVEANYVLTSKADGAEIAKGRAQASASYDRLSQRYAAVRAARDAEVRIARLLSDQIQTRVAATLAARS
jgi:LPS-assembly lipoprotein